MNKRLSKTIGIILVFALIHSILPMAAFAESATVSVSPTSCTNGNIDVSWTDFPSGSGIVRYEWSITSATEGFSGNSIDSTETSGSSSLTLPEGQNYVWLRAVYTGEEYGEGIRSQIQYNRDLTDPSVSIESPANNDVVNGTVPIDGSVSDDNLDSWVLEYGEGTEPSSWSQINTGNDPVDDTFGNWDTGSLAGTYTLRLSANDLAGNSPDPVAIQVTIDSPPSVPTGLSCTSVTGSEATLVWTASTDDVGVASYIVHRDGTEVGTATSTTYTDTGLSDVTTYTYTVVAEDTAGNQSSASDALEVTTTDATAPDTPDGLTCESMADTRISISWAASDDNVAVTEYDVYRDGTKIDTTSDKSYTDTGLSENNIYGYTVKAKDAEGNVSDESKTLYAALSTDIFNVSDNENDTLTITGYCGTDTVVHIPSMIGGNTVTAIGDWAFCDCSITNVTIPDTITCLGVQVFAGCVDLASITIPGSVTSIEEGTFGGCSSLEDVIIENGVASIGNEAFIGCSSLINITVPGSVTNIGNGAFQDCSGLANIVLENGVANIGEYAFYNCGSLTSITIPDSVTSIGDGAFQNSGLADITIESGLTSIGDWAFAGCGFTELILPDSVTSIGEGVFYDCGELTSIAIPEGVTDIAGSTFQSCTSLTGITIPDGVTGIGEWAFEDCGLTAITLPDSVTSIGDGAFCGCDSLTGITIPGGVTNIGESTFENCYDLENISIQNGVTSIGNRAFHDCSSLASITIPGSVTDIGSAAFESCESLAAVSFSDGLIDIGEWSFAGCGFTDITIPDSVTSIGDRAFAYCYSLENAAIPSTIIFETTVFEECPNLTITILDRTPPAAPTDLSCTSVTRDAVTFEWTASTDNDTGVTGYIVYRDGVEVGTAADTTYTDTGLTDTTTYTYTVSAEDAEGNESAPSQPLEVTTLDATAPTSPTGLTCTSVTGTEAILTWTASTDNVGVTGYIVYRDGVEAGTTADTTFTDTGLTDSTTYTYTVVAEDADGNVSASSAPLELMTSDMTAPLAPTDLVYTSLTDWTVSLSWSASTDNIAVVEYDIYRDGTKVGTTSGTEYTDSGLSGNTIYIYTVKAKDAAGNESDASNAVSATTIAVQFTYTVNADDSVTITGYSGMAAVVNIPAMIAGHTVSRIGDWAFYGCVITDVTIPDTVTSIGEGAFGGCGNLASISLPDSVISLGDGVFSGCGELTSITIPDNVTSIGAWTFENCESLEDVSIPNGVTSIGNGAFYECSSLTEITIPGSVTNIGDGAFQNCGLENITILTGVISIGDWAFAGCDFTDITVPDSVTSIGEGAFYDCGNLTGITIPVGVTSIGGSTFQSCMSLTNITIPDGVTDIGEWAFDGCSFTNISLPDSVTDIGNGAFCGCSSLASVTIPGSVISIGESAFENCYGLEGVSIQNGVTSIGNRAFHDCSSLMNITIPGSVTVVGSAAFESCENLAVILLSDGLLSIGEYAFAGCCLAELAIPDSVTGIGDYAFAYCYSLENAVIPSTITVGSTVFEECPNLTITILDRTPPSAPTDLSAISVTDTETIITWAVSTDNVGVTGYTVYRDGAEIGTSTDTTYTDTELSEISSYAYTIIAEDAEGNQSDPSETLEVTTLDVTAPTVPTDLSCTSVTDTTVKLAWTASTDNAWVSEYDIYRDGTKIGSSPKTSYTDDGLSVDTTYTYTVQAKDVAGNISALSNEASAITSIYYYSINSDGTLTITGYGGTDQDIVISDMIADKSVTTIGDRAFYGRSDLISVTIPVSVTSVGECAFADCPNLTSAIVPSTLYVGPSVFEGCPNLTITIWDQESPLTPTNLTCTSVTGTSVTFTWTASADNIGVAEYIIYRDGTEIGNTPDTTYTDTDLVDGRQYMYTVMAIDAEGNESEASEALEVSTPDITVPSAPSDLTWTSMDKNSISLKWTAAEDNVGVVEYDIYRNGSKIDSTSETSYYSEGLSSGKTYTYKIKAKDTAGNLSVFSNSFSLKTSSISYEANTDGTISVVDYTGTTTKGLTIPSSYGGKTVTGIGDRALEDCRFAGISLPSTITNIGSYSFLNCARLTKVIVPNNVISIGDHVFEGCVKLASATLSTSLTNIGAYAFYGCAILAKITIPDSVTIVGEHAFEGCSKLASATTTVSSSLTSIGAYAFTNCIVLASIVVPDTVTSIGEHAFEGCSKLASATLSSSLTRLGAYAFKNCIVLANITIPNSVTSIGAHAFDGCSNLVSATLSSGLTSLGAYAFNNCSVLANITIPDSVTSINAYTFGCCDALQDITIPDGITRIGRYAFYGCSALQNITIPDGVMSIDEYTFGSCSALQNITIPDSVTSIGRYAFSRCDALQNITIPDGVTSIGIYAFSRCDALQDITIPDSVTSIGDATFSDCSALQDITIPDGVTSIGGYAFYGCSALQNITMPDGVTSIGERAFSYCYSLENIAIPDNVTSIGKWAFCSCSRLQDITIPDGVTSIGEQAFYSCDSFQNITIPNGVTNIEQYTFYNCSNLVSIILSDNLTSIGDAAFSNCTSLTSLEIPGGVTSIGESAFQSCSSLASLTMPDSVINIGDSAFSGCDSLADITIPDSVTSIGDSVFSDCDSLASITIPDSVTSIGDSAFSGCISLAKIAIPNSVTSIGSYAFANCTTLITAIIPSSITVDSTVFDGCTSLEIIIDYSYPEAPSELSAEWITEDSIRIVWEASTDDTGVTGYKIYRDGVYIDDTDQTTYADTGLARDTVYAYTIKAYDTVQKLSEESDPIQAIISDPLISGLTVYDTENADSWAAVDNFQRGDALYGDASYTVAKLPSAFSGMQWIQTADASKGYSDIPLVGFTPEEDIQVYIAHDMAAESIPEWMNDWTATGGFIVRSDGKRYAMYRKEYGAGTVVELGPAVSTGDMYAIMFLPELFVDTQAPQVPSSAECGVADTSVVLSWEASSDNIGTLLYEIYRDGVKVGETAEPRYEDTVLTPETSYTYTIQAKDLAGNISEPCSELIVHTLQEGQSPYLLSGLNVYDTANSEYWSLETNLKVGDTCYYGKDNTFTQIPECLYGSEWVKPYDPSKNYVADVLCSVDLTADAEMYILYDAAVSRPAWMDGWIKTGDTVLGDGDQQFNVYRKRYEGCSTVEFGSGNSECAMYIVAAKPCMSINEDLTLSEDMTTSRNLYLDDGTIDLNGHTLTVKGNLIQSGGTINIGSGQLQVNGDYRIQTEGASAEDGTVVYSESDGSIVMEDTTGTMTVDGSLIIEYPASPDEDTELSLHGDVQVGKDLCFYTDDTSQLNDDLVSRSITVDLEVHNCELHCGGNVKILADTVRIDNAHFTCEGDLYVDIYGGDADDREGLGFFGQALVQVGGDTRVSGDMRVDDSSNLTFKGDFLFREATEDNGEWSYSPTEGVFKIVGEQQPYMLVEGDFVFQSNYKSGTSTTCTDEHVNQLISGAIAVMGDFYQKKGTTKDSAANFNPVDDSEQTFVLCGEEKQTVHFDTPKKSKFNILGISKPIKSGYRFNKKPVWRDLVALYRSASNNGKKGVYAPNGNYSTSKQDLLVNGPYFNIAISRTYNSNNAKEKGAMGYGWMFGYEGRVTNNNGLPTTKQVVLPDGSKYTFSKTDGKYKSEDTRSTFVEQEDGYLLTTPSQYKYFFNPNGFLLWIEEPAGNRLTFGLNAQGKPEHITDEVGRVYTIVYNEAGYMETITDPFARVVSYAYDADGHLTEVTDPAGYKQYYEYDDKGTLSAIKDHVQNVLDSLIYTYDKQNNPTVKKHTDTYGNVFTYSYNKKRRRTTIKDSLGRVKTVSYDGAFAVMTETDYEGKKTIVRYQTDDETGTNLYGEIESQTDRRGNTTQYERDDRGNVAKLINPDDSYKVYQYDERNNVIYQEDENRNKTYYEYYSNTNLVSKIICPINGTDTYEPGGSTDGFVITRYEYYTESECESLFGCDVTALLKATIDGEGNRTGYTYDTYGNQTGVTYPEGNAVHTTFNEIGWAASETSGEGYTTQYEYNDNGNLIRTILDGGETTLQEYDYAGRVTKNVSSVLYETGEYAGDHGYRYTYSPSGLLMQQVDPEGNTATYTYDIYGNKATETLPNGAVYLYTYDKMNRVTQVNFKVNADEAPILLRGIEYKILSDKTLQVTQKDYMDNSHYLATKYVYDYANRLISTTQPDNTVLATGYNDNGTVASTTDAAGYVTYFDYDGLGRMTGQWIPFNNADESMSYSFTSSVYDKADNLVSQREYLNPLAHGTVSGPYIGTANSYDGNGNLLVAEDSDGYRSEYRFDQDDQLIEQKVLVSNGIYQTVNYDNNYFGKPDLMVQKVRAGDLVGHDFNDDTVVDLTTAYEYDANGNLTSEIRPDGASISYAYDLLDRPISVSQLITDEHGSIVLATQSTTYDYAGNVLTQTDREGNTARNVYDKRGFLTKTIDPMGGVDAFYYDRLGRVTAEVTPENYIEGTALGSLNRKEYTYDKMGRIVTEAFAFTDGTSYVSKAYAYNAKGDKIKELDALGYAAGTGKTVAAKITSGYGTQYTYDCAGNVLSMLDPVSKDGGLTYTKRYIYDGRGRKISEKNADGSYVRFEYDSMGNVTKTAYADGMDTTLSETIYDYDLAGNPVAVTDANGNMTQYRYNALNEVAREIQPGDDSIGQNSITYQYDMLGNLVKQSDSFGTVTQYTYDELNRDTSKTVRNGDGTDSIEVEVRYDLNDNPRFTVDGNGNTIEKTYDANNRLLTERMEAGGIQQTTAYTYDANGNQLTATDWLGNITRAVYDPLNRIVEKWDAEGNRVEKLTYNNNDQQTISQDARGNRTYFAYDKNNRLTDTTDEEEHTQSQGYDDKGNISVKTDARGNETHYEYDAMNRLIKVTNALDEETVFTYDGMGNRLSMEDGRGNVTTYEYNARNLVIAEIEPGGMAGGGYVDGLVTRYTYFCKGMLETTVDKNGTTTANTYDIHGHKLSQVSGAISISYTYDDNGNLLTMTDGTGTTARTYDERNRALTKQVPVLGTSTYVYDLTEGLTEGHYAERSTDPNGNVVVKEYDKAGRLSTVTNEGETTTYEYYPNGSRQRVVYADCACEEYEYYPDNQVQTLTNKKSDGTIITTYSYVYDEQNNLTSKTDGMGVTSYGYDALNRIAITTGPAGDITAWAYDDAGNRARQAVVNGAQVTVDAYTYDTQNRLTLVTKAVNNILIRETEYTNDDNGNQTQVDITPYVDGHVDAPIRQVYAYDELNRLTAVETADTEAEYTYNGDGLRVSKTVGGDTENYLYEGSKVVLETDGENAEIAVNVYGLNLVQRETGGVKARYMYNGHADVTALLGENDDILASYYYDAFGNITMKSGNYDNPYRYSGYRYDEETKNYYLAARYYNPLIARFLQEDTYRGDPNDPLSLNLYTYCSNNPLIYVDPSGHRPLSAVNPSEETKEDRKISTNHMKTTSRRTAERTAARARAKQAAAKKAAKQDYDMDAELRREKRERIRIRGWGPNGKPKNNKTSNTSPSANTSTPTLTSAFAPTASISTPTSIDQSLFMLETASELLKNHIKVMSKYIFMPTVETIEQILSKKDGTYTFGINLAGTPSFWNGNLQGGLAIDTKGNVALQGTFAGGPTTGNPGGSATLYEMKTNAPSIDALEGMGYQVGGSAGVIVEGIPLSAGAELNIIPKKDESKLYIGRTISAGIGTPGAELHVEWGPTKTWDKTRFNVFDEIRNIYNSIMEW